MKSILLLSGILFTGVSSNAQTLQKAQWNLYATRNLETGAVEKTDTTLSATLEFKTDSTLSARSCNGYMGKYRYNKKERSMSVIALTGTKRYCPGPPATLEKKFIGLLRLTSQYQVTKDTLKLMTTDKHELIFTK